jgi:hypothetical protein
MLSHVSVRPAATRRPVSWRAAATMTALVSALATFGCAQTPAPISAAAADAGAPVAQVRYRPVLGDYAGARPTEPAPWTGGPKKEGSQ